MPRRAAASVPRRLGSRAGWLVKTEPEVYSIDDLARDGRTGWDGVRNHQARNFMRDSMKVGDLVLVYHSNADPPGVAGLARVCGEARPDPTAFDPADPHFDPRSRPDRPTWMMAELEFVERFPSLLPLDRLRAEAALEGMPLLARGQRLSVQPVSGAHFDRVLAMARGRG